MDNNCNIFVALVRERAIEHAADKIVYTEQCQKCAQIDILSYLHMAARLLTRCYFD
jgi:hypothetical protein